MADIGVNQKMQTLKLQHQPRLTGKVLNEADDAVVLQVGGCVVEIPPRHIAERTPKGDQVELTLSGDAKILVTTSVSVQKGFLADDVFGELNRAIVAEDGNCACNCNCNCGGDQSRCNCNCNCTCVCLTVPAVVQLFRRPVTGGAKGELEG